jgi:OOP family OmpA-OmpF porin
MKKRIIFSMLATMFAIGMSAQEAPTYPHAFVSVQGGVMRPYNGEGIDRKFSPMGAVSFGYNFTNYFGLRLQANGSMWTAENTPIGDFKSKAANIDLDMLFNLSNVIFPNKCNKLNVIAIAGAPFNIAIPHAWVDNYCHSVAEGGAMWNSAWKVGGMLEYNLNKKWAVNLEGGTNYVRQKHHGVYDDNKWWPYAMVGVTFRLGQKKAAKHEEPVMVEEVYFEEEPYTEIVKKQRPIETVEQANMEKVVFYSLAQSDANKAEGIDAAIKDAAELIKTDPEAKITVTGYADKGTGTAVVNKRLSKERAEGVTAKLINEYGVNAANITTDFKGDTEQPYAENDKNRCVIIKGEGKFKVTKYEEYEEKVEKTRQVEKTRMVEKK